MCLFNQTTLRGGVKMKGIYRVNKCILVLVPTIGGTISISFAIVQVLGAASTLVPNTPFFLLRLTRLWRLTMSKMTEDFI